MPMFGDSGGELVLGDRDPLTRYKWLGLKDRQHRVAANSQYSHLSLT